jgi:hypothetical protein
MIKDWEVPMSSLPSGQAFVSSFDVQRFGPTVVQVLRRLSNYWEYDACLDGYVSPPLPLVPKEKI